MYKEKCKILKEIRLKLAQKLGINLSQEPCTYEGECEGTCPACQEEEKILNEAIVKEEKKKNKKKLKNIFKREKYTIRVQPIMQGIIRPKELEEKREMEPDPNYNEKYEDFTPY